VIPIYEAGEHEGQLYPVAGAPRIAVGAGAVWAANPDGSVSRIDAKTARIVATRNGRLGMDDRRRRRGRLVPRQRRPDHRRHPDRPEEEPVTQRVPVGANSLAGVAVGAGSVWAAANDEGVVWRIDPQRPPILRTIDVSKGVSFVTFGERAVWTGNYVDGTVARIDPGTNDVTARASVGAPQALRSRMRRSSSR